MTPYMPEHDSPAYVDEETLGASLPLFATAARFIPLVRVCVVAGVVLGLAAYLVTPARYRSTSSFFLESGGDVSLGSGVAALAGRFGVGGQGKSADLMAELATSDRVLIGAVHDSTDSEAGTRTIFARLATEAESRDDSVLSVVSEVRKALNVSVRSPSGLVQVTADHADSSTSRLIAYRVLSELRRFDLQNRTARGTEKTLFFSERLLEAREALNSAEAELASFVRANRQWQQSPDLSLAHARLERQVSIAQQEFVAMSTEVQRARLEQESKLAGLVVVDEPFGITRRSSRAKLVRLVAAFGLVQIAGVLFAAMLVGLERSAARGDDVAERVLARLRSARSLALLMPK